MTLAIHDVSVTTFMRLLRNLDSILDKAADERGDALEPLLHATLAPDMYDLTRQVQLCSDFAKGAAARLAGIDNPRYADSETTLLELKLRIAKTLEFLASLRPEQFAGAATREIDAPIGGGQTLRMRGDQYLLVMALPNFYFHYVTAYDILRHHGVALSKRDFIQGA